jgi:hypothetical protein
VKRDRKLEKKRLLERKKDKLTFDMWSYNWTEIEEKRMKD